MNDEVPNFHCDGSHPCTSEPGTTCHLHPGMYYCESGAMNGWEIRQPEPPPSKLDPYIYGIGWIGIVLISCFIFGGLCVAWIEWMKSDDLLQRIQDLEAKAAAIKSKTR